MTQSYLSLVQLVPNENSPQYLFHNWFFQHLLESFLSLPKTIWRLFCTVFYYYDYYYFFL